MVKNIRNKYNQCSYQCSCIYCNRCTAAKTRSAKSYENTHIDPDSLARHHREWLRSGTNTFGRTPRARREYNRQAVGQSYTLLDGLVKLRNPVANVQMSRARASTIPIPGTCCLRAESSDDRHINMDHLIRNDRERLRSHSQALGHASFHIEDIIARGAAKRDNFRQHSP